eukprot:PhM_4_TR11254/c0_g1_i10/m.69979
MTNFVKKEITIIFSFLNMFVFSDGDVISLFCSSYNYVFIYFLFNVFLEGSDYFPPRPNALPAAPKLKPPVAAGAGIVKAAPPNENVADDAVAAPNDGDTSFLFVTSGSTLSPKQLSGVGAELDVSSGDGAWRK